MKKRIFPVVTGFLITLLVIISCMEQNESAAKQSTMSVPVPDMLQQASLVGNTLYAEIEISGLGVFQMTVNQADNTASFSMGKISPGDYTLTVRYYVNVPTKCILATQSKPVTINAYYNSVVAFSSAGYDESMDDDSDNVANLLEIIYSGDPLNPGVQPSYQCVNGLDDDGDTFKDYPSDPDCMAYDDQKESYQWEEIGTGSASGGGISNNSGPSEDPSLALDSTGNPVVAWRNGDVYEIYIKRWNPAGAGTWEDIGIGSSSGGGISNNAGSSENPSLALDSTGNPVVAWDTASSGNGDIYIKRWNGSAWVDVGTNSSSGGGISFTGKAQKPSLALDSTGNPIVAWEDSITGNKEIYIKRWNGSAWVEVGAGSSSGGGISNNIGPSRYPSLALDSSGNPVVAWVDNSETYIKRWNGSAWVDVGTDSSTGGGISNNTGYSQKPSLALDVTGKPVVAWDDYTSGNGEIYIRRWNLSAWVEIGTGSASGGGISDNYGESFYPSLDLDSAGNPVVAWMDDTPCLDCFEIYIKRWNGSAWVDVRTGSSSGGGISNSIPASWTPSLALDSSGNPTVAWYDCLPGNKEIYIKRWLP